MCTCFVISFTVQVSNRKKVLTQTPHNLHQKSKLNVFLHVTLCLSLSVSLCLCLSLSLSLSLCLSPHTHRLQYSNMYYFEFHIKGFNGIIDIDVTVSYLIMLVQTCLFLSSGKYQNMKILNLFQTLA